MEISNGWILSLLDTEPLNVTMPNLMQSVLSSSRGVECGGGMYRKKYRWLVLMDRIRKKKGFKKKQKMLGKLGCEVPQECVQDLKTGPKMARKMSCVNLGIQVASVEREG